MKLLVVRIVEMTNGLRILVMSLLFAVICHN